MCDSCSNDPKWKSAPGTPERERELRERRNERILEHGHEVVGVSDDPYFFYTVGRSVFDKPELLLTGNLDPRAGMTILNSIAALENEGRINLVDLVDSGAQTLDGFDAHLKFVYVNPVAAQMFKAIELAGTAAIPCIQVIWPDHNGAWPDEPSFAHEQPVYSA